MSNNLEKEYLSILEVKTNSTFEEIKSSRSRLIHLWHPDKNTNNEEYDEVIGTKKVIEINKAYKYIKDNYSFSSNFEYATSEVEIDWENRTSIKSSNIKWVEYYKKFNILIITFNSGGIYLYEQVPEDIYFDLHQSVSKGKFVNKHIARSYKYHRLERYSDWLFFARLVFEK